MRPFTLISLGLIILLAAGLLLAWQTEPAKALPEYSAQTGEPCATCHLSPSGGGSRGPRGQAWVGGGKPAAVPDLAQSLELLGIKMDVDASQYLAPATPPAAAEPLRVDPAAAGALHQHLKTYDGN